MIKKIFLIISLVFSLNAKAYNVCIADTIQVHNLENFKNSFRMLEPTYLTDVVSTSAWRNNWFVNLSGGVSAFIGSPVGCEDLFGRIKPAISLSVGKWFTPTVGSRISYQGWQLKDSELYNQKYMNFHADLLVNLFPRYKSRDRPHYDIVPYVGLGLLHNEDNGNNPFAFSYGVMGRYSLTPRLHLTMELGGTTTFKNFDGHGDSRELGDNLLGLTAGLSFTIGKAGWKRVVDATPYILQNKWLSEYATTMEQRHLELLKKCQSNAWTVAELKKILEIEGLLEKYGNRFSDDGWPSTYDYSKNNYSGLNSLRKRLHENTCMGTSETELSSGKLYEDSAEKQLMPIMADSIVSTDKYINGILSGKICIGNPVHFFFILGTAELTDRSQLVNVDEIARLVKLYGLFVHVTGTADSATGNEDINAGLGTDRAQYISTELIRRGVSSDHIRLLSKGGINVYQPNEANRQVQVELYFP